MLIPNMLSGAALEPPILADIDIEVDGGITDETIKVCADAGANIFVAGSYVFSGDYKERIDLLKSKAN